MLDIKFEPPVPEKVLYETKKNGPIKYYSCVPPQHVLVRGMQVPTDHIYITAYLTPTTIRAGAESATIEMPRLCYSLLSYTSDDGTLLYKYSSTFNCALNDFVSSNEVSFTTLPHRKGHNSIHFQAFFVDGSDIAVATVKFESYGNHQRSKSSHEATKASGKRGRKRTKTGEAVVQQENACAIDVMIIGNGINENTQQTLSQEDRELLLKKYSLALALEKNYSALPQWPCDVIRLSAAMQELELLLKPKSIVEHPWPLIKKSLRIIDDECSSIFIGRGPDEGLAEVLDEDEYNRFSEVMGVLHQSFSALECKG